MNILGLSGKKGSGKNTCANGILGLVGHGLGIWKEFAYSDEGKLVVSDIFGDHSYEGVFDYELNNDDMNLFKEVHLDEYIKLYSMADVLKKEICINLLGLTYEQCYGTDEQKNSFTHLKWENMPGVITNKFPIFKIDDDNNVFYKIADGDLIKLNLIYHEPGLMTGRDIMQYIGTDIFRRIYGDVWVNAGINKAKSDNANLAIFTDIRFPNEVEGIHKAEGKTMRLTRNPYKDNHESETALDGYEEFSYVMENKDINIKQQWTSCFEKLNDWNFLD